MTLTDDHIDDLVRDFRAPDALLDDATRARITARVGAAIAGSTVVGAGAPAADLDSSVILALPPRRARRRRPAGRALLAAAAVLVVALAGVAVVRADGGNEGTADAPAAAPGLDELAAAAEALPPGPVLGDPGATYAFRALTISSVDTRGRERVVTQRELWVALDGTGRRRRIGPSQSKGLVTEPGELGLGGVPAAVAITLPSDADGVAAAFAEASDGLPPLDYSHTIVDTLAAAGLPPTARAGLLRLLHQLDFRPAGPVDPATGLARYEGPGVDGSAVSFAIDTTTLGVASLVQSFADGRSSSYAYTDVRLRDDLGL